MYRNFEQEEDVFFSSKRFDPTTYMDYMCIKVDVRHESSAPEHTSRMGRTEVVVFGECYVNKNVQ